MPKLVILVGVVASGKSTLAEKYKEYLEKNQEGETVIVSSDQIREELLGDINDQTQNDKVFTEVHKRIKKNIADKNVIVDATNVSMKSRRALLNCVKKRECQKVAIVMTTPLPVCKKRNANRDRVVPEWVIDKQVKSFQIPYFEEGFDEIHFDTWSEGQIANFKTGWNLKTDPIFKAMEGFDQRNNHHLYTLEEHCMRVSLELGKPLWKMWDNKPFIRAATIHDLGKLYTGEPKDDGSGNYTYKSHMNVGTYALLQNLDCLGFNNIKDIINCLFYINYHMEPFFWLSTDKHTGEQRISEKTEKKERIYYGDEKYENLLLFNYADRAGSGTDRENLEKDFKAISRLWYYREHPEAKEQDALRLKRNRQFKIQENNKFKDKKLQISVKGKTSRDSKTTPVKNRTPKNNSSKNSPSKINKPFYIEPPVEESPIEKKNVIYINGVKYVQADD